MTVLVTGGAGYIGSHMALRLGDAGEPTVVLDNLTTGFDWAVDHRATLVTGDAGDMAFVGGLIAEHKITEIIHFAGSIVVPDSVAEPHSYYLNNTDKSRTLIESGQLVVPSPHRLPSDYDHYLVYPSRSASHPGLLAFRASRTTINPLRPKRVSALVTVCVYRITRNPMYVGLCCILLAWAVHLAALPAFLGPPAFVLYVTRFQIVPEERALAELFGERYLEYAARVRRWL